MVKDRWYLAGPMTGIPQFNFPAFYDAAAQLRARGTDIVSPAELDDTVSGTAQKALESEHGDLAEVGIEMTHGDFLARDVKLIADECYGIIFLDGWEKSKGARLEAFVGLQYGRFFARYCGRGEIEMMAPEAVLTKISRELHEVLRNG
jgi:hypothetical protein